MENRNDDLRLLIKRIILTTVIFGLVYVFYTTTKDMTFGTDYHMDLDEDKNITVYDTVQVRSKEALTSQVIVKYNIKLTPKRMNTYFKRVYDNNQDQFIDHYLKVGVRQQLKINVQKYIFFNDSIAFEMRKFQDVVMSTVEGECRLLSTGKYLEMGIDVASIECTSKFDPKLLTLIENEKHK